MTRFSVARSAARSALCIGALAFLPTAGAQELPARIRIGELMSSTGAAASASAGLHAVIRLAIKEINEKGGIAGRPVDLIQGDDGSDATQAVS
ncbi:MAG TPA: ABC transporter substrate-binding protein, partial [Burkholderiales bacterium]|nr:ABC transporter substrate-binding protein [Burkholderiales bacterium]